MKMKGFACLICAMSMPLILFAVLKIFSSYDKQMVAPMGHFYIVSSVSILATLVGVLVGVAGSRIRNMKVSFLSLAFISLAGIFAIHGLSTPGFLMHASHIPGISSQVSVLLATFWLWLSALSADHPAILLLSRWKNGLVGVWLLLLTVLGAAVMLFPNAVDFLPLDQNPLNNIVMITVIGLNAYTMHAYYRSYRYSRFPLQIAIAYSCGWLMVAQVIIVMGDTWMLSWWLYHVLLLAAVIVMLLGLYKQYAAKKSLPEAVKALFTSDPVERVTDSISPSVRALIAATESKDTYTAGHNFRVTLYALRIAEELEMEPEQLRAIAQGAIIHDVGKINIPDAILNKPDRLTDEERKLIETHPVRGYEMCKYIGFMKEELDIIRSHHERWDGNGYPDRLGGEQIPLVARIAAVADVYDALTSHRAYRQAWEHAEAMNFIRGQKGSHFDPWCVEAWERVCERDPQAYKYPSSLGGNVGLLNGKRW